VEAFLAVHGYDVLLHLLALPGTPTTLLLSLLLLLVLLLLLLLPLLAITITTTRRVACVTRDAGPDPGYGAHTHMSHHNCYHTVVALLLRCSYTVVTLVLTPW
jgi:uncharacterized membrane protein